MRRSSSRPVRSACALLSLVLVLVLVVAPELVIHGVQVIAAHDAQPYQNAKQHCCEDHDEVVENVILDHGMLCALIRLLHFMDLTMGILRPVHSIHWA